MALALSALLAVSRLTNSLLFSCRRTHVALAKIMCETEPLPGLLPMELAADGAGPECLGSPGGWL